MTNLTNQQQYSTKALKYLYSLRWGVETAFGTEKNQLQLEQFSGHRVICIEQDYAATLFVANLQRVIAQGCEQEVNRRTDHCKLTYKINRNLCWGWLKHKIVKLFLDHDPGQILLHLEHVFKRHLQPVGK